VPAGVVDGEANWKDVLVVPVAPLPLRAVGSLGPEGIPATPGEAKSVAIRAVTTAVADAAAVASAPLRLGANGFSALRANGFDARSPVEVPAGADVVLAETVVPEPEPEAVLLRPERDDLTGSVSGDAPATVPALVAVVSAPTLVAEGPSICMLAALNASISKSPDNRVR
jgi:hypothetical protein